MKHMNADHAESVFAYAHWYAKMPEAKKATMLDCTEEGFLLQVEWQGGGDRDEPETVEILVKYAAGCQVSSARDLHKAAVAMHMEAFRELGFVYRVKTGYYRRPAMLASRHGGRRGEEEDRAAPSRGVSRHRRHRGAGGLSGLLFLRPEVQQRQ